MDNELILRIVVDFMNKNGIITHCKKDTTTNSIMVKFDYGAGRTLRIGRQDNCDNWGKHCTYHISDDVETMYTVDNQRHYFPMHRIYTMLDCILTHIKDMQIVAPYPYETAKQIGKADIMKTDYVQLVVKYIDIREVL